MLPAPLSRCRSKTPFCIRPNQADAIVHASTISQMVLSCSYIFSSQLHSNIVKSALTACRQPTSPLGELERLALELIRQVCLTLDIKPLPVLRQTNARAQGVVKTFHRYKIVTTHAFDALYVLLQTGSTPWVTIRLRPFFANEELFNLLKNFRKLRSLVHLAGMLFGMCSNPRPRGLSPVSNESFACQRHR